MTYVYVVCKGDHGEGHDPVSAHAEYVAALSAYNDVIGARPILQRGHGRYLVELDGCDELWIYRMDIQSGAVAVPLPATEEPDRTLTAPERRAESDYIAPFGVVEARIAQVQEYIAAGQPVVWPAAGGDDPNDEITGGAK